MELKHNEIPNIKTKTSNNARVASREANPFNVHLDSTTFSSNECNDGHLTNFITHIMLESLVVHLEAYLVVSSYFDSIVGKHLDYYEWS